MTTIWNIIQSKDPQHSVECPECKGSGMNPEHERCDVCDGVGEVRETNPAVIERDCNNLNLI